MAVIYEHFDVKGRDFVRAYSDTHHEVVRDGIAYAVAEDPAEFNRQYEEGENLIDGWTPEQEAVEILSILTGGES